jgi:hypothetical protein
LRTKGFNYVSMSRPHGNISGHHSNASSIHASITFTNARQSLVQTLENLSFVKVVTIQNSSAGYTGEAVEVHFRDARDKPKLVFFDKFGRSRSSLTIGPIKVSQAPLGLDHPSAIPTVGEILVGSLVPNARKSHLDHVLRGWSSDATPLKELLRLLKFGTKHSEFEVRQILLQPAALLSRSPMSIKKSRDDIYMTARIILWSSLRPLQILASIEEKWPLKITASPEDIEMATNIKISCKAVEFIEAIVIKFNDSKLSEDFFKDLEVPEVSEVETYAAQTFTATEYPSTSYGGYGGNSGLPVNVGINLGNSNSTMNAMASDLPDDEYDPAQNYGGTPPYGDATESKPKSPSDQSGPKPSAPSYESSAKPSSPAYRPSSPAYVPSSRPESPGNLYEDL